MRKFWGIIGIAFFLLCNGSIANILIYEENFNDASLENFEVVNDSGSITFTDGIATSIRRGKLVTKNDLIPNSTINLRFRINDKFEQYFFFSTDGETLGPFRQLFGSFIEFKSGRVQIGISSPPNQGSSIILSSALPKLIKNEWVDLSIQILDETVTVSLLGKNFSATAPEFALKGKFGFHGKESSSSGVSVDDIKVYAPKKSAPQSKPVERSKITLGISEIITGALRAPIDAGEVRSLVGSLNKARESGDLEGFRKGIANLEGALQGRLAGNEDAVLKHFGFDLSDPKNRAFLAKVRRASVVIDGEGGYAKKGDSDFIMSLGVSEIRAVRTKEGPIDAGRVRSIVGSLNKARESGDLEGFQMSMITLDGELRGRFAGNEDAVLKWFGFDLSDPKNKASFDGARKASVVTNGKGGLAKKGDLLFIMSLGGSGRFEEKVKRTDAKTQR